MLSMFELKPSDMASDADQNDSDGVQVRKTVAVQPRTCNNNMFWSVADIGMFSRRGLPCLRGLFVVAWP